MKRNNGNPAAAHARIRVSIEDLAQSLCYTLPSEEWERLRDGFDIIGEEQSPHAERTFMTFDTLEPPLTVMVRRSAVQLVHFVADPVMEEVEDAVSQPDWHLRLVLRGRQDAFESLVDDPQSAEALVVRLDADPDAAGKYFSFTDAEGEDVVVDVDQIVVAEVDRELLEGLQETSDGSEEEAEGEDLPS
jgi:hypothetical protein